MDELPKFEPVKISCTSSDCENGTHCFRPKRGEWKKLKAGRCVHCGADDVDMELTRSQDAQRVSDVMSELRKEHIRDIYLRKPLDEKARRLIQRDGFDGVRAKVRQRLTSRIGGDPSAWDGRQTPWDGDVLNYAQHATATCCRKCTRYWYGFEQEGALSDRQLDFCEALVLAYLDIRESDIRAAAETKD